MACLALPQKETVLDAAGLQRLERGRCLGRARTAASPMRRWVRVRKDRFQVPGEERVWPKMSPRAGNILPQTQMAGRTPAGSVQYLGGVRQASAMGARAVEQV